MLHRDAGHLAEQDRRQMAARADAKRRIGQLPRMRLGVGHDVADRVERRIRRYQQHILPGRHQIHRCKIRGRIEALHRRNGDIRRHELAGEQKSVAVRRGPRGDRRADIAAGAGTVLDHRRLAPGGAQFLHQDAAQRVDTAAGRKRNDQPHGAIRIVVAPRADGCKQRSRDDQAGATDAPQFMVLHAHSSRDAFFVRSTRSAYRGRARE